MLSVCMQTGDKFFVVVEKQNLLKVTGVPL